MPRPAEVPGPLGARHPSITPFEAFATADGYIIIAAGNNLLFAKLCSAIGRDDLPANPLFAENDLRTSHHAALKQELEAALRTRTTAEWLAVLEAAGVPCGPINNVDQVLADPQVARAQHDGERRRSGRRRGAHGRQPDQALGLRRPSGAAAARPTSTAIGRRSSASSLRLPEPARITPEANAMIRS